MVLMVLMVMQQWSILPLCSCANGPFGPYVHVKWSLWSCSSGPFGLSDHVTFNGPFGPYGHAAVVHFALVFM